MGKAEFTFQTKILFQNQKGRFVLWQTEDGSWNGGSVLLRQSEGDELIDRHTKYLCYTTTFVFQIDIIMNEVIAGYLLYYTGVCDVCEFQIS